MVKSLWFCSCLGAVYPLLIFLTSREKPTVWSQMILSDFHLTQSEHRTHCCTEITKDKNVQIKETMCSRYSIQTRSSLIPVYVEFSYLHFLCACEHKYSLICGHIRKCSLCGFCTQWILLRRLECWEQRQKIPFFPGHKPKNQLFSIGEVGFLKTAAVPVCLSAAIAKIPGLLWHPKDIALLPWLLLGINSGQLWFKSHGN